MGVPYRNGASRLAQTLLARGTTLKSVGHSCNISYPRMRKLSAGSKPTAAEMELVASVLGVPVAQLWPIDLTATELSPPLLRKWVNDALSDEDTAFMVCRLIEKLKPLI